MEFCPQNYIVTLLIFTVFFCDESTTSPCDHQARITIVPEDALIRLDKISDDGTPEFIVKPGITTFRLNCQKTKNPVLWKVKLARAHTNSSIETNSKVTTVNEIKSQLALRICHTTSLEIKNVGENITGLYSCLDLASTFPSHAAPMFIYGGNEVSPTASAIINRGQQIKMDLHDTIFDGDTPLRLPCTTNTPANITVAVNKLVTRPKIKAADSKGLVQMPARRCGESLCVELKKIAKMYGTSKGIQLMCRDGDKNYVRDIVLIKVLLPDFRVQPLDQRKLIHIPFGQKLRFECQSEYPVRMTTNYSLGHTITTKKEYVNRQASHRSTLELTYGHPSWVDQWNTMYTSISCEREDKMQFVYSWNYTFVKTQNNQTYNTFESQVKLLPEGKCATLDTSLATVYIVPCSTYTECQMKSPLLYSNNTDYRVQTEIHSENFVKFKLPVHESSFMIRCVSFQSDVMTIIYSLKEFNSHRGSYNGILSTVSPLASDLEMHYPLISANVTEKKEIIIYEKIHLNCTVPVMRYASRSYWAISFRNESELIIPSDNIMYEEEIIADGMSTLSTIIQLTSTEVVSVNCINYQFLTVQPFVMREGLFVNNDDVTAEKRMRIFSVYVKDKPVEKTPQYNGDKADNRYILSISVIGGIFTLSAIITATFLLRSYIQRKIANQIQEHELKYFLLGRPELISDTQNANSNAQHKAYNESYEIPIKDLHIDYQTCLGSGEFGMVFKAVLNRETPMAVAVKSVKPGAGASYLRSAMAELKVMLYVQSHKHIIKVIGAYTKNLINHELFVVMEYSDNGSLLQYLQRNSENFVNQVQNGNLELKDTETFSKGEVLATTDLIKWANQIANGMKYISSLNVIHGDLAARNILLDAQLNIKISDFGLSKKMYEFSQYVRKNSCPVPWRWLAVESINFTEFSCSSDIWAFGVTLWEIFSLGAVPYPGQEFNTEFIKMLTNGYRLPLPEYSTFEIYNIILQCWRKNPQDRPKFDVLNSQFTSMVEAINAHQKSAKKNSLIQEYQKSKDKPASQEDTLTDGYVTFNMLDYIDINEF